MAAVRQLLHQAVQGRAAGVRRRHLLLRGGAAAVMLGHLIAICIAIRYCFEHTYNMFETCKINLK